MNWIITEVFFPDEVSTAEIMTDIARQKLLKGKVGVICGPTGYEKSYSFQKKTLEEDIEVYRVRIPELNKNKIISRFFRLIFLTFKMGWHIITKVKKQDEVLLVTNPAFLVILVALLKKIKRFNLEILVHDIFPENLIPAGIIKKKTFKYTLINKIYNFSYRKADKLIVLGEDMKELMYNKLHNDNKTPPIKVITNWADPNLMPISSINISEYFSINLKGKIVIGFAGNLGRLQGLLEFIRLLSRASNPYLSLVIIGDGALKEEISREIKVCKLQNVHLVGPKPRYEQLNFLNACDIGLITLKSGMKGLGVPSKTYNIMAVAKPLLYVGDSGSEVDSYISEFDCGWSFDWSDEEVIVSFLKSITFSTFNDIRYKGLNSLKAVKNNYTKEIVLKRF